ncbi:hypothetical protein M878_08480 [Streptomyces roseochromogenus subsp. oscitans DS 12.976]|uniref:Uncharacterized protein n=1 Tax=Streptomyces roseochromogenus subsp. oscitans DS 12.976 TaxID=1352936 RepID=V6KRS1_STRRC|nr:hypothetical protein M878_08480 [Streptomyces roseochromogenus subsp. oscitans DS 12.976]
MATREQIVAAADRLFYQLLPPLQVEIVLTNRADIQDYGCPVGTLTTELAKLEHAMLGRASRLFAPFRTWLREQFAPLGPADQADQADELAMHVIR